jgi:hypothetical protein
VWLGKRPAATRNPPGTSGGHLVHFLISGGFQVAKSFEVEFPVIVRVEMPDGVEFDSVDVVDAAWSVVPHQKKSFCIKEVDCKPVAFATVRAELQSEKTKIDGVEWKPPQEFYV